MKIARIKHKDEIQYGIVSKDSKGGSGIDYVIPKKSIENCIKADLPETVEKMIEETGCGDWDLKSIYDSVEANLDNIEKIPINNYEPRITRSKTREKRAYEIKTRCSFLIDKIHHLEKH